MKSKHTAQNAADLLSKMAMSQIVVDSVGDVQTKSGKNEAIYID